jgi:hypothetical protein
MQCSIQPIVEIGLVADTPYEATVHIMVSRAVTLNFPTKGPHGLSVREKRLE